MHLCWAAIPWLLLLTGNTSSGPKSLQTTQAVLISDGVEIHYPARRKASAIRFLRVLPEARASVRSLTGAGLVLPVTIELLSGRDEFAGAAEALGSQRPDRYIQGLAFGALRRVLIRLDEVGADDVRARGLLIHELVHIAIHEFRSEDGAAPIPRWFDEGVAQFAEGRALTELILDLPLRARVNALIPFSELDQAFLDGRRAQAYVQAESFVRFLARTNGGRRLVRTLLSALARGVSLDAAIHAATFVDLEGQEQRWQLALMSDVGANLRAITPLLFAIFLALAVLVILYRSNARRKRIEAQWAAEEPTSSR